MLNNGKLIAGVVAAAATLFCNGVFAADGKGALYGDFRWSLDYAEDKTAAPGPGYNATDNNSFWGVKASITQDGMTAFGAYERFLDTDALVPFEITRQSYAGLKCDVLGTVKFGQFETDYYQAGRKLDLFYNTAVSGIAGVQPNASILTAGNSHGQSATLNGDFVGSGISANQLAYTSPSFAGVTVNAALFMDDAGTGPAQDHDFGGGVEFNHSGITAGVQALDINSAGVNFTGMAAGEEVVRVYGGYSAKNFGANVSVERHDLTAGATDAQYHYASAWFGILPGTRLAASVGSENESGAEGDSVTLGVFHDVIENFTTWVAARRYDGKNAEGGIVSDVVTLGASYKFDLGFSR